jgi:flagellar hook-associated protein 1 FlgK
MIRSTFYGFSTALSGLRASQTALDVIGQNVSNANTEGYTRQRVNQDSVVNSTTAERYGSTTSPRPGQGVSVNSLSQIRDTTLDARFRIENPSVGRYDAEVGAMSDIESVFDEAITSGMRDSILALQTSFQNLSLNTGNDEFDALSRASASSMSKLMNQYAQQLEDAYDQELYDFEYGSVSDANNLLRNIASMDKTILKSEVAGDNPLELYDQRNTMLDELSSYMDLSYYYEKVTLASNITTNVLHVSMKKADGQSVELIDGNKFAQFGVEVDEGYDKYTIADNTVSLKVSGLTDTLTDTYTDIVKKMAVGKPPKEPTDVTPVYGEETKYTDDGKSYNVSKYNPDAVTNGIFYGTLNMLNASGDYEMGGSTVRGYKYYVKALDTLASTMATQINEQNRSVRFTTKGETLYNISYLNETTGARSEMTYGNDGSEIAARIKVDADGNPLTDNNGNFVMEYGYITLDDGNYNFDAITDQNKIDEINFTMASKSNKMFLNKSTPAVATEEGIYSALDDDGNPITYTDNNGNEQTVYAIKDANGDIDKLGTIDEDTNTFTPVPAAFANNVVPTASDESLIYNVKDSDGNAVKTYNGDTVYSILKTDANGNLTRIFGTVTQTPDDPFSFDFTELSDEDQMYIEAASGYKKYTTDGEELLSVVVPGDNTLIPPTMDTQAMYQGKAVYAVEREDAGGNTVYEYGYIDHVDSEPYYNFTALPEAYQANYAVQTAANATAKMKSADTVEPDVFTYDEEGGEYRQKNDFDVNNLNEYWDENLFSSSDGVSTVGITAKYIAVSDAWMQSDTNITNSRAFSYSGDDNSGDNSNILRMIQLFDNSTSFNTGRSNITLFNGGYESFLSTIGDTVALDVSTSTTRLDSYDNVLTSIDSDRMSVSGVNIDEEAVDIYQYQRAYEAASRVMTALDELLDKLINSTGTVGR